MDDSRARPSRLYVEPRHALPNAPCVGAQRLPQITKRAVGANNSSHLPRDSAGTGGAQASTNQRPRARRGVDRGALNTASLTETKRPSTPALDYRISIANID